MRPEVRLLGGPEAIEAVFSEWARRPHTIRLQGGWDIEGMGRFTYLGIDPYCVVMAHQDRIVRTDERGTDRYRRDPFIALAAELAPLRCRETWDDLPFDFQGGAMGYLGYGLRRFVEDVPARCADDLGMPDLYFPFYDLFLVYDHLCEATYVVSTGLPLDGEDARERARRRIESVSGSQCSTDGAELITLPDDGEGHEVVFDERHSSFTKREYLDAVRKAKAYIAAGDVYQVNLAQRFNLPLGCDPAELFATLRRTNPSPLGAYVRGEDWSVVSVSPERYFRYDGQRVETRPIKGTRPRSADPTVDQQLKVELMQSAKDQAEHVMIVDLERNDLGRFCRTGSVRVPELMIPEAHPTVWHLVSTVVGVPRPNGEILNGVRLAFPGGSITGAPKVRAMEIIDELEPVARSLYTGSIGYFGVGARTDLNIAIRTISVVGGKAYFHVGGGIVADSDPEDEYQETLDKGLGIARALAVCNRIPCR